MYFYLYISNCYQIKKMIYLKIIMKLKKLFLISIIFHCFNSLFASMSPNEYMYPVSFNGMVAIEELYISTNFSNPIPVKEFPSNDSPVLFYLPDSSPLKVVYTQGTEIDHYAEYHWNSNYTAIILPMEYREKGKHIGWIDCYNTWWEPNDKLDCSQLSMRGVNAYLDNSLWKFSKKINNQEYTGIICFEKNNIKGIFISTFSKDDKKSQKEFSINFSFVEEDQVSLNNKICTSNGTTVFCEDKQNFIFNKSSFTMEDSLGVAYCERINPLSFSITQEDREKEYHGFVYGYLINRSKYGYRLWQKDSKYEKNIFELMNSYELNKPELVTFAIENGVLPLDTKYNSLYNDYWNPIIIDVEKKLDKNCFTKIELPEISPILRVNKIYATTDHLRLRKSSELNSDVITTLDTSSCVLILKIGTAEVIDGLISNWVKVRVLSNSIDVNGKTIKEGTEGWCFAGYLVDNG